MKHIKIFEDFSGMGMNQGNAESFVVLTGNEGGSSYAVSHVKDKHELESLEMGFTRDGDDVFDVISYNGKNYVGSGFHSLPNYELKLTPYETAEEGITKGNYYEFYSDDNNEQMNQRTGVGEGILFKVPPVGFTLYADKGYATLMSNREYINGLGKAY
jgi:hypothetical protein